MEALAPGLTPEQSQYHIRYLRGNNQAPMAVELKVERLYSQA